MRCLLALLVLAMWPAAASAAWHEASSEHFVVYADQSEKETRLFAEQLERFHATLELLTGQDIPPPSPSSRVTVFMLGDAQDVRKLLGTTNRNTIGSYRSGVGGYFAFVPGAKPKAGRVDLATFALLNAYTQYFQSQNVSLPHPSWMKSGAGDFYAEATFLSDGGLMVGQPSKFRLPQLLWGDTDRVERLLDPNLMLEHPQSAAAKCWLLYHYLTLEPSRRGQIEKYLSALSDGVPLRDAAERSFGNLAELESSLRKYAQRIDMLAISVPASRIAIAEVKTRQLSEVETLVIPWLMRSKHGVTEQQAREIVNGLQPIAARYPNEPVVFSALAEAHYDARNDAAAIDAANKALALDPGQVNAYVQKGFALFRKAADAEDKVAAYDEAVKPFLALNAVENDHPLPLRYFYEAYTRSGREPPDVAKQGLEYAFVLAPSSGWLRFELAIRYVLDGRRDEARKLLAPVVAYPERIASVLAAQKIIGIIDRGEETSRAALLAIIDPPRDPAKDEEAGEESDEG